jgi:hypothetical protein
MKMEVVDFSFMKDASSRYYVEDAYKAVSAVDGGWAFLKEFVPEEGRGFMFSRHPMLDQINARLDDGHSGASYGWTMRQMEYIAKHGLEAFQKLW